MKKILLLLALVCGYAYSQDTITNGESGLSVRNKINKNFKPAAATRTPAGTDKILTLKNGQTTGGDSTFIVDSLAIYTLNKITNTPAITSVVNSTLFATATAGVGKKTTGSQLKSYILGDSIGISATTKQLLVNNGGKLQGTIGAIWDSATGHLGLNSSSNPQHRFSLVAPSTDVNAFNIVSWANKNRTTAAQARDSANASIWYTPGGTPNFIAKTAAGATIFTWDTLGTAGAIRVGINGDPYSTYQTTVTGTMFLGSGFTCGGGTTASASYFAATTFASAPHFYITGTAAATVGYSAASNNNGGLLTIKGQDSYAGANWSAGSIDVNTGRSRGSGTAKITLSTSGGGLTDANTDLTATAKVTINSVGGLIYLPKNTTQTGGDSLTITGIPLIGSANVSNMGAFILNWNGRVTMTLNVNTQIDTTNATEGQFIIINNTSPTAKTLTFTNGSGGIRLLSATATRVLGQGDASQFECIKINNKRYWMENWNRDVTP